MKSALPESWWAKGVFQIQPSIFSANFSNNINIPSQVNMRKTEHEITFETI